MARVLTPSCHTWLQVINRGITSGFFDKTVQQETTWNWKQQVKVEHLQSGDQTVAPEGSAWQAMPHFWEIGCTSVAKSKSEWGLVILNFTALALTHFRYLVSFFGRRLEQVFRLQLHGAIYRSDSFVLMLHHCVNLKAIRYESTSLNRIAADKSHRVIVA